MISSLDHVGQLAMEKKLNQHLGCLCNGMGAEINFDRPLQQWQLGLMMTYMSVDWNEFAKKDDLLAMTFHICMHHPAFHGGGWQSPLLAIMP